MKNWKFVSLGEICDVNKNSFTKNDKYEYINYLDTGNITENKINDILRIDDLSLIPSRAKRKIQKNDVIFSTVRPNQKHYGIIKKPIENMICSTGFAVISGKKDMLDNRFLYYYLSQDEIVNYLQVIAENSVSVYPSIKPTDITKLKIKLPEITEQRKIADILDSLSNKIEYNSYINQNLEAQAQAIFKSWFVDRNNPERKVVKAEEIFDISIGKTPPRKETKWFSKGFGDICWISISDMGCCGAYISSSSEYLTKDAISKFNIKIVPDNTVILSFKLTVGRVAITDGMTTTNEAIAHFSTKNKSLTEYLYCYLKNYNFQSMGNTSSIATAINSKIIKNMPLVLPENGELTKFHNATHPLFLKIKMNLRESNRLSQLRDTLLPKLMSGEIDVSDVAV